MNALTNNDKRNLLADLNEAFVKTSNSASTGYRDMRIVLALWGFEVNASEAMRIYNELSNEFESVNVEPSFKELVKAHKTSKVKVAVGMTITYKSPKGEDRTGIVTSVSSSGKTIQVNRPDGSLDYASRSVAIA